MRVLIVSPYLPHRSVGHGGGVSVRELTRHLARRHETHLLALVRPGEDDLIDEVTELGVRLHPVPFVDRAAAGARQLPLAAARARAWLRSRRSGYPYYVEKYHTAALTRAVTAAVERLRPDVVQIEYLQLSLLCRDLRLRREQTGLAAPRLVLNSHELGAMPLRRRAEITRHAPLRALLGARARSWERLQAAATGWADVTLCVTDQDRALLEAGGGRHCVTMPLGIDTAAILPVWDPRDPPRLLFVGSFGHRPNRVAAKFLVDKVWPNIAQCNGFAHLVLAGRGSDVFLSGLGRRPERVQALGYVEDLTPLFRECRLFVAPLAEGGGIKIKILEAMARGIPVLTTPIGAEGIVDSAEDALAIAGADTTFAEAMIRVLAAPEAARGRAERARRIIEQRFSWSAITERLTTLYEGG
ncbi:MAG: glycosyltransferase family 4 protein [Candidatus Krumholzibacteriia bacterium]